MTALGFLHFQPRFRGFAAIRNARLAFYSSEPVALGPRERELRKTNRRAALPLICRLLGFARTSKEGFGQGRRWVMKEPRASYPLGGSGVVLGRTAVAIEDTA